MRTCTHCDTPKQEEDFDAPFMTICKSCSDEHLIEKVDCTCSVCKRKLPSHYFGHYRTRFKSNLMRLRVNTNCKDCSRKESKVLAEIKKQNPPPAYLTECPQCNKTVYEKVEDIELLRAIENDMKVYSIPLKGGSFSIDVNDDYIKAKVMIVSDKIRNLY